MSETIHRVDYYYTIIPDKPGEAARVLNAFAEAGVNFTAVSAFPAPGRKSQLDFLPENSANFSKIARKLKLKLSSKKSGFFILGVDRPGAVAAILSVLGGAGINVTSMQAVCAGAGRYGGLLWVKPADLRKAAGLLDRKISASPAGRARPAGGNQPWGLGATESQVNVQGTIGQRIDRRGTKVEDLAGTGKMDSPGG